MEINITQKPPFQGKVFFLHFYMNLSHVALTSDGYDAAPGFNWLFSLNSSPQTFQHVGVSCQGPNNLDALFSDELSTTIFCLVLFVTPPPILQYYLSQVVQLLAHRSFSLTSCTKSLLWFNMCELLGWFTSAFKYKSTTLPQCTDLLCRSDLTLFYQCVLVNTERVLLLGHIGLLGKKVIFCLC